MSDILFTHSYFYKFDRKQWETQQPYPPYGTLYAAALMRSCGFEVGLFDTALRDSPAELESILQREQPRYLVIYDDGFNYLTKMCLTRMREAAFEMAKMGKKYGCHVIVNSSDSTDHEAQYLAEGADFVILGEGEQTLRALIQALEAGVHDFSDIAGLAYQQEGNADITRTAPRPVLNDLDSLPDPAWDLVDMDAYRQVWMRAHGFFSLNLATTRGCPYKCNWCAKPIYGNRYNSRSPERVVAEIEYLIEQFGVRHFWMADDIFGLKPGWPQRFRDLAQAKKLKFEYKIQSRVDLLLKEDTIDALAASGLRQVWVGAESGSQKILDAMDKGTKVEEIAEATHLLKKKGIEVCFFLQFGYLGETKADIEATLDMLKKLEPHDIGISVSYPLPGTKFYEKVKSMLGAKQNWEVSDDLAMMYPATYSSAYYRRLHRLVHKQFRLQQGRAELRRLVQGKKTNLRRAFRTFYYAPAAVIDRWRLRRLETSQTTTYAG
ncbi:MAG: B12-binding domain-containing radical SAM protein [Saprospiraceae bacterium]|nr:B12-binding domain-containing radical SAM protein [Saprospiraceae bacterium]